MARGQSNRPARIASLLREVVAEVLANEVKDPRTAAVTLSDVEVTGDLREARVFFFVPGGQEASAQAGLERAKGFIRRELGRRVQLRVVPEILFRLDSSIEYGARIEAKLRELAVSRDEAIAEPGEEDEQA